MVGFNVQPSSTTIADNNLVLPIRTFMNSRSAASEREREMDGGAKVDDELQQALAHLWNHIFGFVSTMSVACAVELAIPEAIHKHGGRPVPLSQLVAELGIPSSKASSLRRLMRLLALSGFFNRQRCDAEGEEAYLLTNLSEHLLRDNPHGLHQLSLLTLEPMLITPYQSLGAWFRGDSPMPFHHRHGVTFWEMASRRPELNDVFNEAMACDSRLLMDVAIKGHGEVFTGVRSLVDVGGGYGAVAAALAEAFPPLKCTVLDLPHVVASAPKDKAVDFVAGDMFEYIPPADAVLLKWVLHSYSDELCVKLLKLCKAAIPAKEEGGKVIIMDMVLKEDDASDREVRKAQYYLDMVLMVNQGGVERSEEEWRNLFTSAGFSGYKIVTSTGLALRDIIELYP